MDEKKRKKQIDMLSKIEKNNNVQIKKKEYYLR